MFVRACQIHQLKVVLFVYTKHEHYQQTRTEKCQKQTYKIGVFKYKLVLDYKLAS